MITRRRQRCTRPLRTARRHRSATTPVMYTQAEQLRDAGDLTAAGAAFEALGDYRDAAEQSESCYRNLLRQRCADRS